MIKIKGNCESSPTGRNTVKLDPSDLQEQLKEQGYRLIDNSKNRIIEQIDWLKIKPDETFFEMKKKDSIDQYGCYRYYKLIEDNSEKPNLQEKKEEPKEYKSCADCLLNVTGKEPCIYNKRNEERLSDKINPMLCIYWNPKSKEPKQSDYLSEMKKLKYSPEQIACAGRQSDNFQYKTVFKINKIIEILLKEKKNAQIPINKEEK